MVRWTMRWASTNFPVFQFFFPPLEFFLNRYDGALALILRHDVVISRINRDALHVFLAGADGAGNRFECRMTSI